MGYVPWRHRLQRGSELMWFDMEDCNPFNWVINFYNDYIKNIDNSKLITIFECTK